MHEDVSYYFLYRGAGQVFGDYGLDLPGRQADVPKYRRGGVRLVFAAVFPEAEVYGLGRRGPSGPSPAASRLLLLEHVKTYYALAERLGITIVESAGEAARVVLGSSWRLGFLLHLEGADALHDTLDLRLLARLGVRSLGLTWNHGNRWAAGAYSRRDYGLTDEGEELVREANRLGVIVDVAHASRRAALEAAEASKRPVIASHTGLTTWVDTPRNITPETLEAIARTGGVVGVTMITPIIFARPEEATIDTLASRIAELAETYGSRVVAIGTDYHGLLDTRPPRGVESIDKIQGLLARLANLGLGDNDIKRIAYENALRVIRETLPP